MSAGDVCLALAFGGGVGVNGWGDAGALGGRADQICQDAGLDGVSNTGGSAGREAGGHHADHQPGPSVNQCAPGVALL